MKSVIELGKQGEEALEMSGLLEVETPPRTETFTNSDVILHQLVETIKKFPVVQYDTEAAYGVKKSIPTRILPLGNQRVFELSRTLATYEPIVYASVGHTTVMGMLSNNYDSEGRNRQPGLKVIPLKNPYPLTSKFDPDARMATMLAGAVSTERKGVGGHRGNVGQDLEHQATILGAVSIADSRIALDHANHSVRVSSSVATGLTNGSLGNLYVADRSVSDFPGYGTPLIITADQASNAILYIPDRFLDSEAAWGGTYDTASRIMLGAGLQALYARQETRQGESIVQGQIRSLTDKLNGQG